MAREERSAALTGIVSTSSAHVRRKAALTECIKPTRNANDNARPYRAQRRSSGQMLGRWSIKSWMVFDQQPRSAECYLRRPDGRRGIRRQYGHQNRRANMTMPSDNRQILGAAVIRIVTRRHNRFGRNGGCERFVETHDRVCKTNKKIHKGEQHQQRPANARRFRLRRTGTDPMFHYPQIASFGSEHYYNVGNMPGNFRLLDGSTTQPCTHFRTLSELAPKRTDRPAIRIAS